MKLNESYAKCCSNDEKTHVHEFVGSVRIAKGDEEPHNHRFAGITDEVIVVPGGHIHKIHAKTDFYEDHSHCICVKTCLNVNVGRGADARHIHFIDASTEVEDGHCHEFIGTTLIDNPIGD